MLNEKSHSRKKTTLAHLVCTFLGRPCVSGSRNLCSRHSWLPAHQHSKCSGKNIYFCSFKAADSNSDD